MCFWRLWEESQMWSLCQGGLWHLWLFAWSSLTFLFVGIEIHKKQLFSCESWVLDWMTHPLEEQVQSQMGHHIFWRWTLIWWLIMVKNSYIMVNEPSTTTSHFDLIHKMVHLCRASTIHWTTHASCRPSCPSVPWLWGCPGRKELCEASGRYTQSVLFNDVQWCSMMFNDVQWCSMTCRNIMLAKS